MKIQTYKGYIFRYLYNQWINDYLGGFTTMKAARDYINGLEARQQQRENYNLL
jgi:hypothetical protein